MTNKEVRARRDAARAAGQLTYQGRPCKKRGHMERYVSTDGCVACPREAYAEQKEGMTREEATANRDAAQVAGQLTYQGQPCRAEGHTERYVSGRCCVLCVHKQTAGWHRDNPGRNAELHRTWRRDNPKKYLLRSARTRAKRTGLDFSITEDDLACPEYCPVFGTPLKYGTAKLGDFAAASLDRIDNRKGYVPGNVRVISYRANRLKSDATPEELQLLVDDANRYVKSHLRLIA